MFFNSRSAFFFVKTTKVNSFVNCRSTAKLITMFIIHTSQIHENSSRMIPSKAKIVWFHILTRTWLTPVDWNYKKSFVSDIIKKWNSLNFTKLEKPFLLSFLGKIRLIYIHVYVLLNLQNNFLWDTALQARYYIFSKIAIIRWANVGILLARRWQMTLARCHFADWADLIANSWFDDGPTPLAQQALHMPT